MTMTVVVTRNVPDRYRGFLASCMLEIGPGVYTSPTMTQGVRDRVWQIMVDWSESLPTDGGVLLTWRDRNEPSGQAIRTIGWPKSDIVNRDGIWVARVAPNGQSGTGEQIAPAQ